MVKSEIVAKELRSKIINELQKHANPKQAKKDKFYFRKEGSKSYGIRSPVLKEITKRFKKQIISMNLQERLNLAESFYKSGISEQASIANKVVGISVSQLKTEHLAFLDGVLEYFNSWGMTDDFCLSVSQPLLALREKEMMKLLEKWNKSGNMWKRRASVVTFTRKTAESGKFIDKTIEFCDRLIWDKEDLVQKAVGWALKDGMRADKKKIINYVKDLRQKGVSAIITLYAIRDLKGSEKRDVLKVKADKKKNKIH